MHLEVVQALRCPRVHEESWLVARTDRMDARHIEAGRVAVSHFLQREGRVFVRIFPHKPVTAKPLEVRMGTGKGEVAVWTAVVKPGTVMFEVSGVTEDLAKTALLRVAHKLPVRTRFVSRRHGL